MKVMQKTKRRVLILGGGFGGMYTALHLDRSLAREPDTEVILINRENFFLFTPMLHEVAASDLEVTHIVSPIRQMLAHVNFVEGELQEIDLKGKRVYITGGGRQPHQHVLEYDHLVIALGASNNFFGIEGLAERAITMRSLGDAIYLRNRLIAELEQADSENAIGDSVAAPVTVVIAGGGFAGVETAAAVNDFLRAALRYYRHLTEKDLRVVLVHAGPFLLPEMGEKLGRYATRKLGERGVEIHLNTRLTGIQGEQIRFSQGAEINADVLVWAAGNAPHPALATLPCQEEHGRILVEETLAVPNWPGVWAVGDCALVPDVVRGGYCPPTAQYALRQGRVVAENIIASLRGGRQRRFAFGGLGQLAAIGRRAGVANVLGYTFSGFVAWWMWRTVYLSKLPRFERKVRVALDWTLDLLFDRDLVQFNTGRSVEGATAPLPAAGGRS